MKEDVAELKEKLEGMAEEKRNLLILRMGEFLEELGRDKKFKAS